MPKNVEVKARLADPAGARATARRLSGADAEVIDQHDIFFRIPRGRLKLRMFSGGAGELIEYHRPDAVGARTSSYRIAKTPDAVTLRDILVNAGLAVIGEVRKRRLLYLVGQTRVHLDCVEGLGDFLELEVVLRDDQPESEGNAIAQELMAAFGLERGALIAGAYVDMLT